MSRAFPGLRFRVLSSLLGLLFAVLTLCYGPAQTATAAAPTTVPGTISFQGKVVNADGTNVANQAWTFVFKLYSVSSAGTALWTETDSITTVNGVFQVNLGTNCSFFVAAACNNSTPIDFSVYSPSTTGLYLGMTFNSDPAGEMSPRVSIQSVPFAFNSEKVGGLSVSQLVQLSPGSSQAGSVGVTGSGSFDSGVNLGSTSTAGSLLFKDGTSNSFNLTLNMAPLSASYNLTLPTSAPSLSQCLKSGSVTASQLIFGNCAGGDAYLANDQTFTGQNIFTGSGSGTSLYGALFKNTTDSATAFAVQNAAGYKFLSVDNLNNRVTVSNADLILNGINALTSAVTGIAVNPGANTGGSLSGSASSTYYYKVTSVVSGVESPGATEVSINGSSFTPIASPTVAPTSAQSNGSGLTGTYCYKYTYLTANGETLTTPASNCTTISNKRMSVTGIAVGSSDVISRNVYRTTNRGSTYFFLTTIADNTTTSHVDNTADAGLGAAEPSANTARTDNNNSTISFNSVAGASSYNVYRGTSTGNEDNYQSTASSPFTDTGVTGTAGTPTLVASSLKFGINTATPSVELDVVGAANISSMLTAAGGLTVSQASTFNAGVTINAATTMNLTGTQNLALNSDLAGDVNGLSFIGTPSTTTGTTNGVYIAQAASANTNGLDNGLTIANLNTTLAIASAINVIDSGGGYTNYISAPNFILAGDGEIRGKGFDVFDPSTLTTGSINVGAGGNSGGNFGSAFSGGAFISSTDVYSQEFVSSLASATTNNRLVGDSLNWFFNNAAALTGQVTSQVFSTTGGYIRMATNTTTARGGLIAEGITAGTLDKPLNAANLPIVQSKVRPSILRITDDFIWGMGDTAAAPTANDTLPANGIFFWTNNSTGAGGWTGVVRSGGATIGTPVVCPGGITANVFATGRIIVVNSTTVRFMIDTNAGDGVDLQDCGTVTGTLPTADMSLEMYVIHTTNTASTFDVDYARFWQDDAPPSDSSAGTAAVSNESTQADNSGDTADILTPNALQSGALTDDTGTTVPTAGVEAPVDTSVLVNQQPAAAPQSGTVAVNQVAPEIGSTTNNNIASITVANQGFSFVDMEGKHLFAIDEQGNGVLAGNLNLASASISGGLTVGGDINVAGLSSFQKLATFLGKTIFRQDVQFDGHITVASDSAGYATLLKNETTVHVTFKTPYETVPLVTANISNGQFALSSVSNVTTKGFDISLQVPATQDTSFTWTAVAVTNPQTSSNPLSAGSASTSPATAAP